MDQDTGGSQREKIRLSAEQQEEIGDILLSARAVSRQMLTQSKEKAAAMLREAEEQAAGIKAQAEAALREAEEKAALLSREAEEKGLALAKERAAEVTGQAEARAEEIIRQAEEKAAEIVREAETEASFIHSGANKRADMVMSDAEQFAAEIRRSAEEQANRLLREAADGAVSQELSAPFMEAAESEPVTEDAEVREDAPVVLSEEMQEYVVRCVGDCFARLRQQQQEATAFINEQWRCFLSGLAMPELPTPGADKPKSAPGEISRQEIEDRVSAIAHELMEIIGK